MKKSVFISSLLLIAFKAMSQITMLEEKFTLPAILSESSGIIFFNEKLISHNDSGNANHLYEIDTTTGEVVRIIAIDNATNVDWEDITQDQTSIYIGDIGNNDGNRTDLKIYKISKNNYLEYDTVAAEVIAFSYADQTDFSANPNSTPWDAEALVSFDENNLILLTKNWTDGLTKAYKIPKTSGTYSVEPLASKLASGGLITGATYNSSTGILYATGYNVLLQPFVWKVENFSDDDLFSGNNTQTMLSSLGFEQLEAICHIDSNRYFMTSESFNIPPFSDYAKLLSFSTSDTIVPVSKATSHEIILYPNPVKDILIIEGTDFVSAVVYDCLSKPVFRGNDPELDLSGLKNGLYLVRIHLEDDRYLVRQILKY